MTTWAGAIVETRGALDFVAVATGHGLTIVGPVTPWLYVETDLNLAHLQPPRYAESLSRQLQGTVIGFFVQTTSGVERIEQWTKGVRVRTLDYSRGAWQVDEGEPQWWEADYFFPRDEHVRDGGGWATNVGDEIADVDVARYERARVAKNAKPVMDLLRGGSIWPLLRMLRTFGADPSKPDGRFRAPASWKLRAIALLVVAFFVGAFLLGRLLR